MPRSRRYILPNTIPRQGDHVRGPVALEVPGLAEQAQEQFGVTSVRLSHRLGPLEIGETSVAVAVASPHRKQAFEACRFVIDTLKRTVPIWKKEVFEDGHRWVEGS